MARCGQRAGVSGLPSKLILIVLLDDYVDILRTCLVLPCFISGVFVFNFSWWSSLTCRVKAVLKEHSVKQLVLVVKNNEMTTIPFFLFPLIFANIFYFL